MGVWIELRLMCRWMLYHRNTNNENTWFLNILGQATVGLKLTQSEPKVDPM